MISVLYVILPVLCQGLTPAISPDGLGLFEGDVGVELVFQQPVKG